MIVLHIKESESAEPAPAAVEAGDFIVYNANHCLFRVVPGEHRPNHSEAEILFPIGDEYDSEKMIPVSSYDTLDQILDTLSVMAGFDLPPMLVEIRHADKSIVVDDTTRHDKKALERLFGSGVTFVFQLREPLAD